MREQELGTTISTNLGKVTMKKKLNVKVNDIEAFIKYLAENKEYYLFYNRCNTARFEEMLIKKNEKFENLDWKKIENIPKDFLNLEIVPGTNYSFYEYLTLSRKGEC